MAREEAEARRSAVATKAGDACIGAQRGGKERGKSKDRYGGAGREKGERVSGRRRPKEERDRSRQTKAAVRSAPLRLHAGDRCPSPRMSLSVPCVASVTTSNSRRGTSQNQSGRRIRRGLRKSGRGGEHLVSSGLGAGAGGRGTIRAGETAGKRRTNRTSLEE